MAKRRSKKSSRRRAPARRACERRRSSGPKGFLASSGGKSITHALLGAGVAAAADTMPAINSMYPKLPGGASTVTTIALIGASMLTKKASTKKMLQGMAMGAAGFAVLDYVKEQGSPDVPNSWTVRTQLASMKAGYSLTGNGAAASTAPAASVQDAVANSYTN